MQPDDDAFREAMEERAIAEVRANGCDCEVSIAWSRTEEGTWVCNRAHEETCSLIVAQLSQEAHLMPMPQDYYDKLAMARWN